MAARTDFTGKYGLPLSEKNGKIFWQRFHGKPHGSRKEYWRSSVFKLCQSRSKSGKFIWRSGNHYGSGPILVNDELIWGWRFFFSAENEAPCSSCCYAFTRIEPVSHDTSKSVEIEPNLAPDPFHLKNVNLSPMEGHVRMKGTAPGGSPTGVGEKPACRDSPGYTAQR